jgi:periplasmic protein TonB
MVRGVSRSYTRQPRAGWFLLLSLLLHLLVVVALNLPLRLWEEPRPELKEQKQNPIWVSFIRPENSDEPEQPEVFAETSSRAQTPEGPKADVANDTKTALPQAPQAAAEPSPPSEAQVGEQVRPQDSPPIQVTPKPTPEAATKRASSPPRRQERAKATTQMPPKPEHTPPEPEPKRVAKLPEPAERTPPRPPQEPRPPARPALESPPEPMQTALPRIGRIPLLSGEDLEKYAQVRSSDQQSSSGGAVSLDTKELKYLSYFAHLKRRIERVWAYPPDAIANGLQGQLHLKFVLRRNGEVKTVELLRSSGYKVLDKEAWDAVINAGPFERFPPTIADDELHITARFTYVLDEAVQRLRMR